MNIKPRLFTKNQLIKVLKDSGNFNYEYIKKIDFCDTIIWKIGTYDNIASLSDSAYEKAKAKFAQIKEDIIGSFQEYKDDKKREEAISYIKNEIINKKYPEEMIVLFGNVMETNKNITAEEIYNLDLQKDFEYQISSEEHISFSGRTSCRTYIVEGTINFSSGKKGGKYKFRRRNAIRI